MYYFANRMRKPARTIRTASRHMRMVCGRKIASRIPRPADKKQSPAVQHILLIKFPPPAVTTVYAKALKSDTKKDLHRNLGYKSVKNLFFYCCNTFSERSYEIFVSIYISSDFCYISSAKEKRSLCRLIGFCNGYTL